MVGSCTREVKFLVEEILFELKILRLGLGDRSPEIKDVDYVDLWRAVRGALKLVSLVIFSFCLKISESII